MTPRAGATDDGPGEVERLRAENAALKVELERLRPAEADLGTFFDVVLDLVCIASLDGFFTRVNRAWEVTLGYTRDELLSVPFAEFVHPEDRAATAAEVARLATGVDTIGFTNRYRAKDGEYRFLEWMSTTRGGGSSIFAAARDVTARIRAEEALRDSEAQLRRSQEVARIGHWTLDLATGTVTGSDEMRRIVGWDLAHAGDDIADVIRRAIHPGDASRVADMVATTMRDGVTGELEFRIVRPDGDVRHLWAVPGSRVPDTRGGLARFTGVVQDITERKVAEEKLKESVSLLKATLQSTADGILVVDGAGRITDHNEQFARLWGIPPNVLQQRDDERALAYATAQLVDPDRFVAKVRELYASPEATSFDVLELNDGRVFERTSLPQRIDGRAVGRVWTFHDVTEQRKAEEALRRSEALFHDLVETAQDLIWQCDAEGRYTYLNPAWEAVFGYRLDEMLGKRFTDFQDPATAARDLEVFSRLKDAGTLRGHETVHRARDGHAIHLVFNAKTVRDARGVVVGSRGTAYDITDRTRAEKEREQFHRLFMTSADIMVIADPNGAFKRTNPACTETLGYSAEELVAKPFVDFVHPDDRQSTIDEMARQLQRGYSLNFENRYVCKDGSFRWLSWRATYVAEDGTTYATARDITEHRRAEEQAARLLEQTRHDDETKGRLLREINHRVKNNLVSLLGLLLVEKQGSTTERLRSRILGMLAAHDMLSEAEWAPLPVAGLAARVLGQALEPELAAGRATLETSGAGPLVSPRQVTSLALVLNELATNTQKYAVPVRPHVRVSLQVSEDAEHLVLRYRDDGPGYPEAVLAGERSSVGLGLLAGLVGGTLRGSLELSNDGGAVTTLRVRRERSSTT